MHGSLARGAEEASCLPGYEKGEVLGLSSCTMWVQSQEHEPLPEDSESPSRTSSSGRTDYSQGEKAQHA